MPVRVFVVSKVRVFRQAVAHSLELTDGIDVAGTAPELSEDLTSSNSERPVVLVDMSLGPELDAVSAFVRAVPDASVVALAVADDEATVLACAEAGVRGYIVRDGSIDDLAAIVVRVARGEMPLPPRVAGSLLRRVAALAMERVPSRAARLTRRETEVVDLVGEGLSNKEIAQRLCIEVSTVKNHVHNVLEKLGVDRREDAALHARRI